MTGQPRRQISDERKAAYYIGAAMQVLGLILFGSTFASFACHFGDFGLGPGFGKSLAVRTFGGMGLIIAGVFVRQIGARGLAGSGVILDPEQARRDVEPWSRMAGGVINDTLSEVEPVQKIADKLSGESESSNQVIKVRCRSCDALNDEDARYCDQCGAEI